MSPTKCPERGSENTEEIHIDTWVDEVEVFRACRDCPTDYCVSYGNPVVEEAFHVDEASA